MDSEDSKFKITNTILDRAADFSETFSAFLGALETAASNEATATDAFVNAVSVSGGIAMNVHGTCTGSLLSLSGLIKTLSLLWKEDIQNLKESHFDMFIHGAEISKYFI